LKYLAIDFGLRHLGLAVNFGTLAEPLGKLDYQTQEEAFKKILKICQAEKIEKIVMGVSEGKMAEQTRAFGKQLRAIVNLPLVFQDETLTSQEAQEKLLASGASQKKRENPHQVAAALILQTFLDNQ